MRTAIRISLFFGIVSIIFILNATAEELHKKVIIGLDQTQNFEQEALKNELKNKLLQEGEINKKSQNLLLIEYYSSLAGLIEKYSKQRIELVKQKGIQDNYVELRRELDKAYDSEYQALKKTHREKENQLNLESGHLKKLIKLDYQPKQALLKERHAVTKNRLKENHLSNASTIKQANQIQDNKLNERYRHIKSLKTQKIDQEYSPIKIDYQRNYAQAKEVTEKKQLREIFRVESKEYLNKKKSSLEIIQRQYNLENQQLQAVQDEKLASLKRVHQIELGGGTLDEYLAAKNTLADFNVKYSYDPSINAIHVETNTNELKVVEAVYLRAKIERSANTIPEEPEYLYGTKSIPDTIATTAMGVFSKIPGIENKQDLYDRIYKEASEYRSLANIEIIKANRLLNEGNHRTASKHLEFAEYYRDQANKSNSAAIAIYQGNVNEAAALTNAVYRSSKFASQVLAKATGIPGATVVVDNVFRATDFLIDSTDTGLEEATYNLVTDVMMHTILDESIEELGNKSINQIIDNGMSKAIGSSDIYDYVHSVASSREFEVKVMKVLSATGVVTLQNTNEEILKVIAGFKNVNIKAINN